jgi:hypothetical protein
VILRVDCARAGHAEHGMGGPVPRVWCSRTALATAPFLIWDDLAASKFSRTLLRFGGGEEGRFRQVGGLRLATRPLGCVARDRGLDARSFSVVARGQAAALRERLGSKGAGTTVRG